MGAWEWRRVMRRRLQSNSFVVIEDSITVRWVLDLEQQCYRQRYLKLSRDQFLESFYSGPDQVDAVGNQRRDRSLASVGG